MSRRTVEIESLAEFDARTGKSISLAGWFVQSVDLTARTAVLAALDPGGAVFLGCTFAPGDETDLRHRGAMIFPVLPDLPFDPYRGSLYTADELYGSGAYRDGLDSAVYAWTRQAHLRHDLDRSLAIALHDHAITDALDDDLARRRPDRVVGVMGGHAVQRGTPDYRAAAELGRALARAGRTVLTGGGPGAMEAANLGAWAADQPEAWESALVMVSQTPSFHPEVDAWASAALQARHAWPGLDGHRSIGIPTWFYGHEPPNAFAGRIAKYLSNAVREDTLLSRCRGGIVYLPGAAGTVQEIFQAVTENYYAAQADDVAPLILVGVQHWTTTLPAWPLLQTLGRGRPMGEHIALVEDVEQASALLLS